MRGEVMSERKGLLSFLLVLLSILPLSGAAGGGVPWKWVMSLDKDGIGVHIKEPTALYYDAKVKRYYVVDSGNQRLVSFDKQGRYLNQFSAGGQLKGPFAMVKDAQGNLWVVEKRLNSLTYIRLKEKVVERHSITLPSGEAVFPDRLAIDSVGTLYLLDRGSGKVVALDKNLRVVKQFSAPEDGRFCDFKLKSDGLWALEPLTRRICHFSLGGKLLREIHLKGDLDFPISLEVDSVGLIYIADRHVGMVKVFDSRGNFKYAFLEKGENRGRIYYPFQLLFDEVGRLCVVEEGNGRVEVFQR